jgi:hypothetical protein
VLPQLSHDGFGAVQFTEFAKHKLKASLHLFIGMQNDLPATRSRQAAWQRNTQFPSRGFLLLALMQPNPQLMKLCFTHDPRQSQQQPIMIDGWFV